MRLRDALAYGIKAGAHHLGTKKRRGKAVVVGLLSPSFAPSVRGGKEGGDRMAKTVHIMCP